MVSRQILAIGIFLVYVNGHPFKKHYDSDPESRIIGGVDAPEAYAPHMAALVWGQSIKSLLCGGSIVTSMHILTAAHCIDPMIVEGVLIPSFYAVVGSNQWASDKTITRFKHYINHPNWDWVTIKNDIGVLCLTEELELNDRMSTIPLSFDYVDGGLNSFVTGWGRVGIRIEDNVVNLFPIPDDLQLLYVETISSEACADGLREAFEKYGYKAIPPLVSEIELCTFHSIGHGMCNGDSGNALVSKESGYQIGVVSWGLACAVGAPDVFARVSAYKDFLLSILKNYL
ncbi:unnamed protein product [Parnassius apollo]|uniref:(apollo) hypothetical protein n=1 Tax=Parnassius apollo TaxID=110799 RepID=A0A8S3XX35_PARAO|nr:unnamed protein product [Parnassius apollo]